MLQDSKTKIEFIRMQILKASQASELSFENNDVMGEPSLPSELFFFFLRRLKQKDRNSGYKSDVIRVNDLSVTLYSRKAHHQPFRSAGGGAVSPCQDRGCGSRGSQECHETSGLWKSHRKEGTFRGRLCKTGQQVKICHFWDHAILDLRWNGSLDCCSKIISFQSVLIRCLILFLSFQAQARFNESSQKLDLLRYSLEQRLAELPKNHPRSNSIIEELSLLSSPALSPRSSIIFPQYSTVTKPAALTGNWTIELFLITNSVNMTLFLKVVYWFFVCFFTL